MSKKILGMDLDGVLYSFTEAVYNDLKVRNKIDCSYPEFWSTTSGNGYGNSIFWDNTIKTSIYYSSLIPRLDDLEIMHRLAEKFTILYITSRPKEVETVTKWYLKNYNYPNYKDVYFASDGKKRVFISSLGVDTYVEDMPKHVNELKNICHLILMKQPWNTELWSYSPAVNNLAELERYLERYIQDGISI
jgi:uncharacterized HAD superfamily protein